MASSYKIVPALPQFVADRGGASTRFIADRRGASFTEYAVLVGLVAIAGMVGYSVFGEAINDTVKSFAETVKELGGS
jgi:Flp pilus assembly pilin Flp